MRKNEEKTNRRWGADARYTVRVVGDAQSCKQEAGHWFLHAAGDNRGELPPPGVETVSSRPEEGRELDWTPHDNHLRKRNAWRGAGDSARVGEAGPLSGHEALDNSARM
ncbi:hypothetical protein NDU88_002307 [Pleurodeles waltl]|uniref:Uncharacterized protein n=1 Tax=Pleurodeles waltl TaxID=8319 RepID=A0AAV7VZ03_PLEWA|nr:hypothetical protein NDU88_002307 [Pleurodeles waltl]